MFKSPPELRAFTHELVTSVWTLASIGFLFESGLAVELVEARSVEELGARFPGLPRERIERCLSMTASAGLLTTEGPRYRLGEAAKSFAKPPLRASLEGEVRTHLMQALAYLDAGRARDAGHGWNHTDRALLQSQGDASGAFASAFKGHLVDILGDLSARLERPGAVMLDVGVGVGSLAIAMCGAFPALSVVGLDVFDVPLAMARENVAAAGLSARIELRQTRAEELAEEKCFEVAWLPTFFIERTALAKATERVRAALRPGGWVLFPIGANAGSNLQREMLALICELWGGPALSQTEGEALLGAAGFTSIRALPGPAAAPRLLAGQR